MAEAEGAATGNRCLLCLGRLSDGYEGVILAIQGKLNQATGAIGAFVARWPVWVIVLSILATALAGGGWARFRIESDGNELWVPQNSQAMKDSDWVSANYDSGGGGAQFLASILPSRQPQYGNNALQLPVFWEMFQVDASVRAIVVNNDGVRYGWADVCETNYNGSCKYAGPLNFWSMSFQTYLTNVNGSANDATAGNRAALMDTVNQAHFPDNTSVSTLSIFGGITLSPIPNPPANAPPFYMSAAVVVSQSYSLRDGLGDVQDLWYKEFIDVMELWAKEVNYSALAFIAGNSVDLEIGRSVTNDLYLIVVSVLIFVIVAVMGLSRWHRVGTRSSLALLGVVSAVLAMVAGYGLSLLFNCPFNTLSQTLPYVLLGLSVDCMFILVKGYDIAVAADPGVSMESRFRNLMSTTGSSVVITLLASAVAFALGSISVLPAVQWFSVYATMGVVCIIVATLTFFTGCFVLAERRIARNRIDCCCCATSGAEPLPTACRTYYDAPLRTSSSSDPTADGKDAGGPGAPVLSAVVIQPPGAAPSAAWVPPPPMKSPSRGPVAEGVEQELSMVQSQAGGASQSRAAVPRVSADEKADATKAAADAEAPSSELVASSVPEHNVMKKLFSQYYAPFLTKWYVKVVVLAIFAGWIVLCGVGIPRLQEGQPLSELAPDDSYLQPYVTITTDTFQQQIGDVTGVYFRYFDPSSPAQQSKMLQALAMTLDNDYINSTISAFQGNWLIDFIGWVQTSQPNVSLVAMAGCSNPFQGRVYGDLGAFVQPATINGCVPQVQFYPLLKQFLQTHANYLEDVVFDYTIGPNNVLVATTIWSSRFTVVQTAQGDDGAYGRLCLHSIRGLEESVNSDLYSAEDATAPGDVFLLYDDGFIFDEGDAILGSMTMEYVLLAVAGVGVVLALTMPSVRAVILMMIAVGMVDYFLFGEMFILNIRFNQVSVINMIMATGLSVDYSVYFAQRFVSATADGTLNGRMALALSDTGSAVFVGGLTALAGTIPLAFASSTILRTFFALIFGTIIFALLVGLMLMPVLFSLIGPAPLKRRERKEVVDFGTTQDEQKLVQA